MKIQKALLLLKSLQNMLNVGSDRIYAKAIQTILDEYEKKCTK